MSGFTFGLACIVNTVEVTMVNHICPPMFLNMEIIRYTLCKSTNMKKTLHHHDYSFCEPKCRTHSPKLYIYHQTVFRDIGKN